MKSAIRLAALAVAAAVLTGCISRPVTTAPRSPVAAPRSPAAAPRPPVPAQHVIVPAPARPMIGVYEPATSSYTQISQFARAIGVQPRVVLYYSGWGENFQASFATAAWKHGAYTFAELEPDVITLASVAVGDSDQYLKRLAGQVRDFRHPVMLSFAHEMNGDWYPWGAGHATPAQFIAAWRHVVRVFRSQGAENVTWVWTVNDTNENQPALKQWWPGGKWVNWVGIDGYFYFSSDTFASVIGGTLAQIRTFTHAPALIGETGVGPGPYATAQVNDLFAGAAASHLAGLVWFDKEQYDPPYHLDWHLADDPAALTAFRAGARRYGSVVPRDHAPGQS